MDKFVRNCEDNNCPEYASGNCVQIWCCECASFVCYYDWCGTDYESDGKYCTDCCRSLV